MSCQRCSLDSASQCDVLVLPEYYPAGCSELAVAASLVSIVSCPSSHSEWPHPPADTSLDSYTRFHQYGSLLPSTLRGILALKIGLSKQACAFEYTCLITEEEMLCSIKS